MVGAARYRRGRAWRGQVAPRGGAVRLHRRPGPSWSRGGRAGACLTGRGSRSRRWARSSRRTPESSSPIRPRSRPRSWTAVLPESDDLPWLRARLLPLLGIDAGESAAQEELFTAWRRFLESVAERAPLVLVVEDVHWADPALLAFLEHLADWARGVPLLARLHCTARAVRGPCRLGHRAAQPHGDQPLPALRHGHGQARLRPAGAGGAAGGDAAAPARAGRRQPAVCRGVRAHAARARTSRRGALKETFRSRSPFTP